MQYKNLSLTITYYLYLYLLYILYLNLFNLYFIFNFIYIVKSSHNYFILTAVHVYEYLPVHNKSHSPSLNHLYAITSI